MSRHVELRTGLFSRERRGQWAAGAILVLAVFLAYQPAWQAGFIWDDDDYVTNNPLLTAPDGLWRIWFSGDSLSQYFPLTYTVFRLEYHLWGLDQTGYHLVNILLHAVNSLLVWRLLHRLRLPGAWLAAAIFALHPVQVESVAWVSELKNVLMGFFFLLSLLCWVECIQTDAGRSCRYYWLALVFFALALASKTTACTLPVVLLLILWWKKEPINKMRLGQITPFLMLSLGMGLLTMLWERNHIGTRGDLFALGFPERILIASHALWFYLGKLLVPVNLVFSYPKWDVSSEKLLASGWLVAWGGLSLIVFWSRRFLGRGPAMALLFYAITLSPLLGFIMLYTFRYTYVADHYQYIACLGPVVILSAAGWRYFKDRPIIKYLVCTGLLCGLAILTWRQARTYENAETLWRATIAGNPGSWMAYGNLGGLLFKTGRVDEAIECDQRALQLNPDYSEGYNNLGVALVQKGLVVWAILQYREALRLRSDDWEVYYNLGNALFQKGDWDAAIVNFQRAAQLQPASADARSHLGNAFFQKGQLDQAIENYQLALKIDPTSLEAHNNLGSAFLRQGQLDQAITHFEQALKINPGLAETHNNLGGALLQGGRVEEAVRQFEAALAIRPDYESARHNLELARQGQRK